MQHTAAAVAASWPFPCTCFDRRHVFCAPVWYLQQRTQKLIISKFARQTTDLPKVIRFMMEKVDWFPFVDFRKRAM